MKTISTRFHSICCSDEWVCRCCVSRCWRQLFENGDNLSGLNLVPHANTRDVTHCASERGGEAGLIHCFLSPLALLSITWHYRHTKMWEATHELMACLWRDDFSNIRSGGSVRYLGTKLCSKQHHLTKIDLSYGCKSPNFWPDWQSKGRLDWIPCMSKIFLFGKWIPHMHSELITNVLTGKRTGEYVTASRKF